MPRSFLSPEAARAVEEAREIITRMRTVTHASSRAEEQSRKAIHESRELLDKLPDGDGDN